MAIGTSYVVAPMLTAAEVVMFLFSCVAGKTSLRRLFRRFSLEGYDFLRIAFFGVSFARTVTRLATRHLSFPTAYSRQPRMRGVREGFELIFMAVFACFATNILIAQILDYGWSSISFCGS
jgi:hypothetical protein